MLSAHDQSRLQGVHPILEGKIDHLFDLLVEQHLPPMFVCQGLRTAIYQNGLYLIGRDPAHPGRIVTDKDGYTRRSNHQANPQDGFGHAVDVAFLPDPLTHDPWSLAWPWAKVGALGITLGLVWGGSWSGTLKDLDHFELPS